jgi:hypothetical protein
MQMPPRPRRVLKFIPSLIIVELWLWDLMLSCMLTGMGIISAEWGYSQGEHKGALFSLLLAVYFALGAYQIIQRTRKLTMEVIDGQRPWDRKFTKTNP